MRPFRFRLETVRRLRDHAEQRARDELARELATRAALADDLGRRRDAVSSACIAARDSDVRTRAAWEAFIGRRETEEKAAAGHLSEQEGRVEEQRTALGHASRAHKAITRLEDKHRERHREDLQRRDELELSDLAGRTHGRIAPGAAA